MHRDEEALSRRLVVQVAEGEAEAVVTFKAGCVGGGGVLVPQSVHLHVALCEVLTRRQLVPPRRRLRARRSDQEETRQEDESPSMSHTSLRSQFNQEDLTPAQTHT